MPFENFKLEDLTIEISKLDVPWVSGETKFTKMSDEERSARATSLRIKVAFINMSLEKL
jgi:hypothetical protein